MNQFHVTGKTFAGDVGDVFAFFSADVTLFIQESDVDIVLFFQ